MDTSRGQREFHPERSIKNVQYFFSKTNYVSLTAASVGPEFEFPLMSHCMVNLHDKAILVIGGMVDDLDEDSGHCNCNPSKETWMYTFESLSWKQTKADLTIGKWKFACGLIYDSSLQLASTFYIAAAGGCIDESDDCYTDSNEMMELVDQDSYSNSGLGEWNDGPSYPYKAYGMATATTSDKKSLISAGGSITDDIIITNIFQLQCWNRKCEWTLMAQRLHTPRYLASAIILPFNAKDTSAFGGDLQCLGNYLMDLFYTRSFIVFWSDGCLDPFVGDGVCDGTNNRPECNYDNGDCCMTSGTFYCNKCYLEEQCICHETGLGHCEMIQQKTNRTGTY